MGHPSSETVDEDEVKRDPTLAEVLRRLIDAYHPEQVFLFGSRARGEDGPDSDYDLLLVVPDEAPVEQRGSTLAYQVLWGTGTSVDAVVFTRSAFDSRRQVVSSLPATALREGRLVHAA